MRIFDNDKKAVLGDIITNTFVDDILESIKTRLLPEQVFSDDQLKSWAEENGYVKARNEF